VVKLCKHLIKVLLVYQLQLELHHNNKQSLPRRKKKITLKLISMSGQATEALYLLA
jgi:hypothetical protein